jgi:hypothetical protein
MLQPRQSWSKGARSVCSPASCFRVESSGGANDLLLQVDTNLEQIKQGGH